MEQEAPFNNDLQDVNLTLFDILAYKEWIQDSSTPLREKIKVLKLLNGSVAKSLDTRKNPVDLNWHVYADNIIFWSTDLSKNGIDYLLFMSSFFLSLFLHAGLPVRGAVAHGETFFSRDAGIYTGPPLVEAHEHEGNQKWLGVSLCESVIQKYGKCYCYTSPWITRYPVPIRSGCAVRKKVNYCLDWPTIRESVPNRYHSDLCVIDDLEYLKARASEKDQRKYETTMEFFKARIGATATGATGP